MAKEVVAIGGASGFWGDSVAGPVQLVASGRIDYLVFDYLAELTMSLLAAARMKSPEAGYATDFVTVAMRSVLKEAMAKGIRIIANAGGVNPRACAQALAALAAEQGVSVNIAVVEGDDVMALLPLLPSLPARVASANAYLGALPIKAALDGGAQVVITGRCVDSAVTLGALLHEFNWSMDDYDRLAAGSLAGHIIECGCQGVGGLHTDWEAVPDWANAGYPIVECRRDGGFTVTKPEGTGGLVTPATVAEQLLYEIGDPARYLLPDVVCDFTQVTLAQAGEHRVDVQGVRGMPPPPTYKVSATYVDGYRCAGQLTIVGFDAARKAHRTAEAILQRTRTMFARMGMADYSATHVEVLGGGKGYGPFAEAGAGFEVVLWIAVAHADKRALELFAREIAPAATSWAPGTTGAAGRPSVAPCIKQFALAIDKARINASVAWVADGVVGAAEMLALPAALQSQISSSDSSAAAATAPAPEPVAAATIAQADLSHHARHASDVPLITLAYARSGDKGDTSNIGVIARRPQDLPLLRAWLTEERVAAYLAPLVRGKVTRYELPGIHAFNFVCEQALDGGGMASLRNDPLGKGMAQILLTIPVPTSAHIPAPDQQHQE